MYTYMNFCGGYTNIQSMALGSCVYRMPVTMPRICWWPGWLPCPSLNPRDVHYTLPWKQGLYNTSEEKIRVLLSEEDVSAGPGKAIAMLRDGFCLPNTLTTYNIWYFHLSHQTINQKVDFPLVGGHMYQTLKAVVGRGEDGPWKEDPKIKRSHSYPPK